VTDLTWSQLAERQHGAIARYQLAEAGLARHVIDAMLASGAVVSHARGVYVARGAPVTYLTSAWIAVLATGGVIGLATAAHVWGMADRPSRIDVIIAPQRRVGTPYACRVHRLYVPRSALTTCDLLPITARAWTAIDHLGRMRPTDAQRFADRALQQRWITERDIVARLHDYPSRTGNTTLRHIRAAVVDGAASAAERRLHRLLRRAGVTGWRANLRIRIGGVLVAVVDVGFEAHRLALEVDGWAFHHDADRFQRDRVRQNRLVALGWTVLRFTWHDLTQRPEQVIAQIVECLPA
jgi:very-short-patch-repair endonuclease